MEVVCSILGPMLASQPLFACFLGFDVPTSSFIFIENVFFSDAPIQASVIVSVPILVVSVSDRYLFVPFNVYRYVL